MFKIGDVVKYKNNNDYPVNQNNKLLKIVKIDIQTLCPYCNIDHPHQKLSFEQITGIWCYSRYVKSEIYCI